MATTPATISGAPSSGPMAGAILLSPIRGRGW